MRADSLVLRRTLIALAPALPAVLLAPCLLAAVLLLRCAAIAHRAAPAAVEVG